MTLRDADRDAAQTSIQETVALGSGPDRDCGYAGGGRGSTEDDSNDAKPPEARESAPDGSPGATVTLRDREPAEDDSQHNSDAGFLRRHPVATLIGLLLVVIIGAASYLYWDYTRHFESTDDAFIAARLFSVAPKVSGYITAVPVKDNQHVATGEVIVHIDDRDYRAALEQADAQVAVAQANVKNIDAQLTVQQAQIGVTQAQVRQAQATLQYAQQQAARYQTLAQRGAGTVEQAQQMASTLHQQEAALQQAQVSVTAAQRQIDSLNAQRKSAEASLAQAKAQSDQAQLNLSYTTVAAAQAGRVVNLTGAIGQFAQAGTALTMFVPDEIWVTANYKETQLTDMRPGQPVTLSIDAYPDRVIRGHVDSVQSGSGTAFSLLPAQNATGNYVKIVQRVPVKLAVDDPPNDVALGPGMSVVPTVRTDPTPSIYERLKARQ